ncbi:MAG: ABC transporter permease [Muribaculaceae bacterium]|nr:ABC transporter permease [Muribaculaceae bacterium]
MLSVRIALRYLFAKKRHTAVNIISIISLAGVAVATAAIVVVLSVFNGFADLGEAQASAVDPDLLLTPSRGKTISDSDSLASAISSIPGIRAVAPVVLERGLLISSNAQVPVRFKGVPRNYTDIVRLDTLTVDGVFLADTAAGLPAVNISAGVAYHGAMSPAADRAVRLYVPRRKGRVNPANPAASFRGDTLLVWSVLRSDVQDFDNDLIILPIDVARRLLDYEHQASAIEVAAEPWADISAIAGEIKKTCPDINVADRLQQQSEAFRMIAIEKWLTFLMLIFILIIASFNVISTLSLLIVEKKSDMEVMRSMGAGLPMIRAIFIWQGWLISMFGGICGIILGAILSLWQQYGHIIKLNADASALTIEYYPVRLSWPDLLAVLGVIAAVSLLAGQTARFFQRKKQ